MDRYSLIAANLLVGNPAGAAVLEAVFQGPEIRVSRNSVIAVCGAEMPPKLDGAEQPGWTSFPVQAGQTLSFGYLKSGARAYIAISGGLDVPIVLGSRSTYPLGALGGFEGRALKAGHKLALSDASGEAKVGRVVAADLRRLPGKTAELRALPGLYWRRITEEAGQNFFEDTWKVAPEADRIGYRFRGGRALGFARGHSRLGRARILPTSSTAAIPTARSRCRAGRSRSSCIATRFRVEVISCWGPLYQPIWT